MKFYDKAIGIKRLPNYLLALAAILISVCMWYFVRVSQQMETQIDVNLDYSGIPQNLVVTSGLINKLHVRLRGPAVLIRSIPREMRNYTINLSMIKKGRTAVPMGGEDLLAIYRAFEVIDIDPPRIEVIADTLVERNVPVHYTFDSPIGMDAIPVEDFRINPSVVTIRGPESKINEITDIPLTIHLDPRAADVVVDENRILDTPGLVTANPPSVRVIYRINSGREVIPRICPVTLIGKDAKNYKVEPAEMTVLVEVPKTLAKDESYLKKLKLSVALPQMELADSQQMKVRVELPEGMTLTNSINENVTIFRKK